MVRRVKEELQPVQFGVPQGMINVMVCNKGGFQIPNESLSMRRIWVIRGGSKMMNSPTKHNAETHGK
jgi:hypothetical protein